MAEAALKLGGPARGHRDPEMALSQLKRILEAAEERGQQVDRAIYGIRIARAEEREPRFLTWEEALELQSVSSSRPPATRACRAHLP